MREDWCKRLNSLKRMQEHFNCYLSEDAGPGSGEFGGAGTVSGLPSSILFLTGNTLQLRVSPLINPTEIQDAMIYVRPKWKRMMRPTKTITIDRIYVSRSCIDLIVCIVSNPPNLHNPIRYILHMSYWNLFFLCNVILELTTRPTMFARQFHCPNDTNDQARQVNLFFKHKCIIVRRIDTGMNRYLERNQVLQHLKFSAKPWSMLQLLLQI